jgi:heat-inducible transcriptional repressor
LNELTERAQHLLKALTERYIREGQPVGSRTLARDAGMQLSPATIRNVIADLEDLGLVSSPHTSAGRIPTVQGYRLFVDTLLTVKPLEHSVVDSLKRTLGPEIQSAGLAETASTLLSDVTRLAGVVTLPKREHAALQRVEFLPLSDKKVLAVLVIDDKDVQNSILQTERNYSASELQEISNYLNEQFAGKELHKVRLQLVAELRETRESLDRMMGTALNMADQVLGNAERGIGEESGYQMLDECSLVTAPYSVDGEVVGVLGVIGPTRMAYERVIPIVDATARILSAALNLRE